MEAAKEVSNYRTPCAWFCKSQHWNIVCLGQNLAMMELRLIAATMLTQCPDAVLADSCTDESMEFENYFVIKPKSHKCELKKREAAT